MGKPIKILFTVIVSVLMFTGGIVAGIQAGFAPVYAASDKTLESECEKKEKANDIDHFFCVTIFGIQEAFGELGGGIQQVIDLLTNPDYGLEEIKTEVSTIESEVLSEDHGLAEIKSEVRDIESRLASMEEKLDQIQDSIESCPNECSGNGVCYSGSCVCNAGYSGADCSVSTACPNDCSGNGVCLSGACFCNPGFTGVDCSDSTSSCPNDCSGHGVCSSGSCFCDAGYSGIDCSVPPTSDFCSTTSCDDGNVCTADTCNEASDSCEYTPVTLGDISCGVGDCRRTVPQCVGGTPNQCIPGAPNPEVCNNIDDDCDGSIDNDVHDPSNSFETPFNLGRHCTDTRDPLPFCPSTSPRPFSTQTANTGKFFIVTADECSSCPADLQMRFDLAVPSGIDYNLYVFDSSHALLGASTQGTSINESVTVRINDSGPAEDDTDLIVEVRYVSGNSCVNWTLTSFNWE